MKYSSTVVFLGSLAGLAAAKDGLDWWGGNQPECAEECHKSFRKEAKETAYCTDSGLASRVSSCLSSACSENTQAVSDFVAATSTVCSIYSGCTDGATQTLTVTRRRGDDDDPQTTTAVLKGCPDVFWGGWGWVWDSVGGDAWKDWCRDNDGWECRTSATTRTVTLSATDGAASGSSPTLSTATETIVQAVSGSITSATTIAAAQQTGDNDDDPDSAAAPTNVHFAGLVLGLFVAVAGFM